MNLIDIVVIGIVVIILASIIYYRCILKRNDQCCGCSKAKSCNAIKKSLDEYHKSHKCEKKNKL